MRKVPSGEMKMYNNKMNKENKIENKISTCVLESLIRERPNALTVSRSARATAPQQRHSIIMRNERYSKTKTREKRKDLKALGMYVYMFRNAFSWES